MAFITKSMCCCIDYSEISASYSIWSITYWGMPSNICANAVVLRLTILRVLIKVYDIQQYDYLYIYVNYNKLETIHVLIILIMNNLTIAKTYQVKKKLGAGAFG
jgi:hypothetical protein